MYWLIGIVVIFALAYLIIKWSIDTNKNPESNLGILDHPSTFEKDDIEMVDDSLTSDRDSGDHKNDIAQWKD